MRGRVFSHYEFEASADVRLTNGDWPTRLHDGQAPAAPEWMAGYRAPRRPVEWGVLRGAPAGRFARG